MPVETPSKTPADTVKRPATSNATPRPATKPGRVGSAIGVARGAASGALHETQKAAQRVGKAAEANPLAAIGAGIAIGVAIGALLPRTKREIELLGTTGRRLTGAASDAIEAARDAARTELATLPLSKEAARAQVGKVFDQVSKAISGAGEAALSGRPATSNDDAAEPAASSKPKPRQRQTK